MSALNWDPLYIVCIYPLSKATLPQYRLQGPKLRLQGPIQRPMILRSLLLRTARCFLVGSYLDLQNGQKMDPILPIVSIVRYWAIILCSFGGLGIPSREPAAYGQDECGGDRGTAGRVPDAGS